MTENNATLLVAIISVAGTVYGYFYEKRKEREFSLASTRREIYQRLVKNLYERVALMKSLYQDPEAASMQTVEQLYGLIANKHPDLWKNFTDALEINAMLCIYGTDPAVKMAALVQRQGAELMQGISKARPDFPALVLTLRKSVYGKSRDMQNTMVTTDEINQLLTP